MSITTDLCPECHERVYYDEKKCPKCGAKNPRYDKGQAQYDLEKERKWEQPEA